MRLRRNINIANAHDVDLETSMSNSLVIAIFSSMRILSKLYTSTYIIAKCSQSCWLYFKSDMKECNLRKKKVYFEDHQYY